MLENVKQNFQSAYDFVRQNPVTAGIVGLAAVTVGIVTGIDRSVKKALPKSLKGTSGRTTSRRSRRRTRVVYVRPVRTRYYRGRLRRRY